MAPRVSVTIDVSARENYKVDLMRRRLAHAIACVKQGLKGAYDPTAKPPSLETVPKSVEGKLPGLEHLAASKAPPHADVVNPIITATDTLLAAANKKEVQRGGQPASASEELKYFIDTLTVAVNELDALLRPPAAAAPAATPGVGPPDTGTPGPGAPGPGASGPGASGPGAAPGP
jgi:hypothetical protein